MLKTSLLENLTRVALYRYWKLRHILLAFLKMYTSFVLSFLLGLSVLAAPIDVARDVEIQEIERRQSLSSTRNDLLLGPCKAVTVIFARGTSEDGNVGSEHTQISPVHRFSDRSKFLSSPRRWCPILYWISTKQILSDHHCSTIWVLSLATLMLQLKAWTTQQT